MSGVGVVKTQNQNTDEGMTKMSKYLVLIFQDETVTRQAEGESISAAYQECSVGMGLCSAGPHYSLPRWRRPSGAMDRADFR